MEGDYLTIYDQYGRLLVQVKKTLSILNLLKLNLVLCCDGNCVVCKPITLLSFIYIYQDKILFTVILV